MLYPDKDPLPRDPKVLLREIDAAIRIKDLETIHKCREVLTPKWHESAIVVMLFVSGLGFIVTVFKLIPDENKALFWFVFGWVLLFTLSLVAAVEFLLWKFRALRRLYEINSHILEQLVREREHPPDVQGRKQD